MRIGNENEKNSSSESLKSRQKLFNNWIDNDLLFVLYELAQHRKQGLINHDVP